MLLILMAAACPHQSVRTYDIIPILYVYMSYMYLNSYEVFVQ